MSIGESIVFGAALWCLLCCICRMDPLLYWKHRLWIVAFHGAIAMACIFIAGEAWYERTTIANVAALCASGLWLLGSFRTWSKGVPWYFEWRHTTMDRRQSDRVHDGGAA